MLEIRTRNANLMDENLNLKRKLSERKTQSTNPTMENFAELGGLGSEELKKHIVSLSQKLQRRSQKTNELEKKIVEVQTLSAEQNIAISQLKSENEKLKKYKKVAIKQDQIIDRYEKLIKRLGDELRIERTQKQTLAYKVIESPRTSEDDFPRALNHSPNTRILGDITAEQILQHEHNLQQVNHHREQIPEIDIDHVKKQPVKHSSGSYRRPSPKLSPLASIPAKTE